MIKKVEVQVEVEKTAGTVFDLDLCINLHFSAP